MTNARTKAARPKRQARAGTTEKVSISLDRSDLRALRRRAKALHGGNLSAAISEMARRVREEEGREALVAWLGDAGTTTPAERRAIISEWETGGRAKDRRRRVA